LTNEFVLAHKFPIQKLGSSILSKHWNWRN